MTDDQIEEGQRDPPHRYPRPSTVARNGSLSFQYSIASVAAPQGPGPEAGAFEAGHLGVLTRCVPFDLVDAMLAETGRVQQRLRLLPSRAGVYFVLALGPFRQ
jgi:hypothetical protein